MRDAYSSAQNILGPERAEQLRSDIAQVEADLEKLRAASLDTGDEP